MFYLVDGGVDVGWVIDCILMYMDLLLEFGGIDVGNFVDCVYIVEGIVWVFLDLEGDIECIVGLCDFGGYGLYVEIGIIV